ncbi:permease [Candidatus Woesearchaeota archaeon]|nr:MAG: permease [Candidatus Woesearchaeota archaeon]
MDIFYPLQWFANIVSNKWLGLGGTYSGDAINFFIYDLIKIGILLLFINYAMAIVRYFFPTDKVRDILTKRRWYGLDYLLAALLGVITPFCSCSSIPLFIGFVGAGIPLGVTFAFLIASPLINEASLYLFPAMFGMNVTILYNLIGITVAILGGMLIQKLHLEKYVETELLKTHSKKELEKEFHKKPPLKELLKFWWIDGWTITKKIFPYVVLGVGVGAIIHGFVPASLIETYLSSKAWYVVPMAVLFGLPFYANSMSVIPVMEALVTKGVPLGTALAFMTAIVTISIPELLILRKVMKWQLLAAFVAITVIGIIILGYILNAI